MMIHTKFLVLTICSWMVIMVYSVEWGEILRTPRTDDPAVITTITGESIFVRMKPFHDPIRKFYYFIADPTHIFQHIVGLQYYALQYKSTSDGSKVLQKSKMQIKLTPDNRGFVRLVGAGHEGSTETVEIDINSKDNPLKVFGAASLGKEQVTTRPDDWNHGLPAVDYDSPFEAVIREIGDPCSIPVDEAKPRIHPMTAKHCMMTSSYMVVANAGKSVEEWTKKAFNSEIDKAEKAGDVAKDKWRDVEHSKGAFRDRYINKKLKEVGLHFSRGGTGLRFHRGPGTTKEADFGYYRYNILNQWQGIYNPEQHDGQEINVIVGLMIGIAPRIKGPDVGVFLHGTAVIRDTNGVFWYIDTNEHAVEDAPCVFGAEWPDRSPQGQTGIKGYSLDDRDLNVWFPMSTAYKSGGGYGPAGRLLAKVAKNYYVQKSLRLGNNLDTIAYWLRYKIEILPKTRGGATHFWIIRNGDPKKEPRRVVLYERITDPRKQEKKERVSKGAIYYNNDYNDFHDGFEYEYEYSTYYGGYIGVVMFIIIVLLVAISICIGCIIAHTCIRTDWKQLIRTL